MKKYIQPCINAVVTVPELSICEGSKDGVLTIHNDVYSGDQLSKERNHSFDADEW